MGIITDYINYSEFLGGMSIRSDDYIIGKREEDGFAKRLMVGRWLSSLTRA
jgi:hypothetical protein